jgi:hypothetical protein
MISALISIAEDGRMRDVPVTLPDKTDAARLDEYARTVFDGLLPYVRKSLWVRVVMKGGLMSACDIDLRENAPKRGKVLLNVAGQYNWREAEDA